MAMSGKRLAYIAAAIVVYIIMLSAVLRMKTSVGMKIAILTGALVLFMALSGWIAAKLGVADEGGDGA